MKNRPSQLTPRICIVQYLFEQDFSSTGKKIHAARQELKKEKISSTLYQIYDNKEVLSETRGKWNNTKKYLASIQFTTTPEGKL